MKNILIPISYARPGRHFLIETDSNEGNHHMAKTSPRLPKADNGDDFATMSNKGDDHATMANKGDDHARKANKGDDYAGRKGKTRAKANKNARAIAKAKLELLQALKANKGDDYASKSKFDFLHPAHNCNQEQNTPQLALV